MSNLPIFVQTIDQHLSNHESGATKEEGIYLVYLPARDSNPNTMQKNDMSVNTIVCELIQLVLQGELTWNGGGFKYRPNTQFPLAPKILHIDSDIARTFKNKGVGVITKNLDIQIWVNKYVDDDGEMYSIFDNKGNCSKGFKRWASKFNRWSICEIMEGFSLGVM